MLRMTKTSSHNTSLFCIGMSWLILSCLFMLITEMGASGAVMRLLSVETVAFFVLIMLNMWRSKKGIFHISTFFVLMMFLFLQGHVMLNAFGLTTNGILSGKFSDEDLIKGILQIHVFMAIFVIAIALNRKGGNREQPTNLNMQICNDQTARKAGYIITLCALPFEIYVNITKVNFALESGYASLYQDIALNSIPSAAKILSYFFLPGCFYIFFSCKSSSIHEKISLALLFMHMLFELLIGYRAMAIVPMMLIIYGLSEKSKYAQVKIDKRIKKRIILLCCIVVVAVVVVFPVVRATRNSGGISNATVAEIFFSENNEVFATIEDMGNSMQTVIYTQQLVPKEYPFRYGFSYLMNLTEAIPNLFWDRHPAEAYGSLGRWLTKIVDKSFYDFGGALGYSCVAESYINFGWFGIIIISYLLGMIISRVENRIERSPYAVSYASWVIVANYLLMYPRGELSTIVRGFFWYMLIPLVFTKLIRGEYKKNVHSCCPDQKPSSGLGKFSE